MTPKIAAALLVDSLQLALDESAGTAACPYCGNDADFSVSSMTADGGAWLTCGCCGNRGRLTANTVRSLTATHPKEPHAQV